MKKKALLVGITDYRRYGTRLEAAVPEMQRWESLLRSPLYGFTEVETLADARATRQNVLDHLSEYLLKDAGKGDLLVFGFCGHGGLTRVLGGPNWLRQPQQVLIAYPIDGSDLRLAAITNADLLSAFDRASVPEGTDLTLLIDACFSGNIRIPPDERDRAKPLFIHDLDPELNLLLLREGHRRMNIERFGSWSRRKTGVEPLIITASEEDDVAYQITLEDGTHRMLFSMRALDHLSNRQDRPTTMALVDAINPLRDGYEQEATIVGSDARAEEPFPGHSDESAAERIEEQQNTFALDALATATMIGSINVRVEGMCCWLKPLDSGAPYKRRLVMPHDDSVGEERHIAFVEIAEDDIVVNGIVGWQPIGPYAHEEQPVRMGTVKYFRWELAGHSISIIGAAAAPTLTATEAVTRHVAQMTKVLPNLRFYPDEDCFKADPRPELVAGLFDVAAGTLDIGLLEEVVTTYDPLRDWPATREPKHTILQLPLITTQATVLIRPFASGSGQSTQITLKPGTSWIRIGNAQALDITGPGSGETTSDHFKLYYKLSDRDTFANLPLPLPVPRKSAAPINACTNSTWP